MCLCFVFCVFCVCFFLSCLVWLDVCWVCSLLFHLFCLFACLLDVGSCLILLVLAFTLFGSPCWLCCLQWSCWRLKAGHLHQPRWCILHQHRAQNGRVHVACGWCTAVFLPSKHAFIPESKLRSFFCRWRWCLLDVAASLPVRCFFVCL